MTIELLLLAANLLCAFALGFIGIEMVNSPPGEIRWKKWLYRCLFIFFGVGVMSTTIFSTIRTESDRQRRERETNVIQNNLSNQISNQAGKLDAIGQFMGQFVQTTQQRGVVPDEAAKAYRAMAQAVIKMAQGNKSQPGESRELSPADQETMKENLFVPETMRIGGMRVRISSIVGDEEAFRFAQQLAKKIFAAAGWTVVGDITRFSPPANMNPLPTGITVTSAGGGMSDYNRSVVKKAFHAVGIVPGAHMPASTPDTAVLDPTESMSVVQLRVWSRD